MAYRLRLTEKKLRVLWRGICVATLRLPQQQFHAAYEITDIGDYLKNSSFVTVLCLITFASTVHQSFKTQEDSRRAISCVSSCPCSITYYCRLVVYLRTCCFRKNTTTFRSVYFEQWSEILYSLDADLLR